MRPKAFSPALSLQALPEPGLGFCKHHGCTPGHDNDGQTFHYSDCLVQEGFTVSRGLL
jgi:hypothetical protein